MFKILTLLPLLLLMSLSVNAHPPEKMFEVTITNITKSMNFTPLLVASTHHGFSIFKLGAPAGDNIAKVAEGGDTGPLKDFLLSGNHAFDVQTTAGILKPGKTVTIKVKNNTVYNHITVISMLLPTNDAFLSVVDVGVKKGTTTTYWAKAYDSGTEMNDETCANIPGPKCGGEGYNAADGEGFVHIHSGIHGTSDLSVDDYGWHNPVAKITIKRIK